jgi:hypothetical protein
MQTSQRIILTSVIAAFLVSGSFALYYHEQATHYRKEWESAMALLGTEQSAPSTPDSPSLSHADNVVTRRRERTQQKPFAEGGDTLVTRPAQADLDATETEIDSSFPTNDIVGENRDWMETLRRTDPARYEAELKRYEETLKRRQKARDNVVVAWNNATNYFANRKTSGMNEKQLAEYNRMLAILNETWAVKQELQGNKLRADDRRQATSLMQSNMVVLAQMLEAERNQEFKDLAVAMGHSETDAAAFAGYINQITSNTTINAIFPDLFQRGGGSRGGRGMRTDKVK